MKKQRKLKVSLALLMALALIGGNIVSGRALGVTTEHDLVKLKNNDQQNLIVDGSFEDGHKQWKTTGTGTFTNYDGAAASGAWCGLLPSDSNNACVYQVVNVKKNTDYIAKAKILLASEDASMFFNVKTPDVSKLINQEAEKTVTCPTGQAWKYQDVELTFNTGDYSQISLCAMKWTESTDDAIYHGQVYVDDVSLVEKNPTPIDDNYNIIWADDFNSNQLDHSKWGYELGCVRGNEQEHYVNDKENVYLKDGHLVLKATDRAKEDQYINPRGGRKVIYNSGSVRTHGKQEFLYGRIEMRAKLPKGQGVFPAFWTLGSDFVLDGDINSKQGYGWARCGEIDIMELIGQAKDGSYGNRTVYQTAHTDANRITETKLAGTAYTIDEDFNNQYHIFGINWSPNKLEWYVDDQIVESVDYSHLPVAQKALNKPQYIQMNLAMGGNWPGDAATDLAGSEFDIDYVYYGQNKEQKAAADAYYQDAPKMSGLENITMMEGDIPNLLKNISVTEGYYVDFSIDDEYMFKSTGGKTECSLRCSGQDDKAKLAQLPVGQYNIHYTAIPNDVEFESDQWDPNVLVPLAEKAYKMNRRSMILTVTDRTFPSDFSLIGEKGKTLSTVALPDGWSWDKPETILEDEDSVYPVTFVNGDYKKTLNVQVKFKEIVDTTQLQTAIKDAQEVLTHKGDYTQESIAQLQKELEAAQSLLTSNPTQKQIDDMYNQLQTTLNQLVKVTVVPTPDNNNKEPTNHEHTNQNQATPDKTVQTADQNDFIVYGVIMTLTAAAFLFLKKEKQLH